MKQKLFNVLAVLALLISLVNAAQPAFASSLLQEIKAAIAPTSISYQGIVRVDGVPFNGTGYFKFAIVSSDGATSRWSNDGTSTGGSAPTNPVPLPVSDGLFSVLLGDTSLSGMTVTLSAQTMYMAGKDCRLRVWFSTRSNGVFTQLDPDRPFSSAPFALVAEYAVEANSLDGLSASDFAAVGHAHDDLYQPLMALTCPAGYAVYRIDASGDMYCRVIQPKFGLETNTVPDYTGYAGRHSSMAIGEDGLPIISYYADYSLKVAHCDDPTCSSVTINILDDSTTVGLYTSIAIGKDGLPVISYNDYINKDLKFAKCNNYNCSSFNVRTLDSTDSVGEYTSITINGSGYPIISYVDSTNSDLKVVVCLNLDCSSSTIRTIDTGGITGNATSITTSHQGIPIISYHNGVGDLNLAICENTNCDPVDIVLVDNSANVGLYSSITIGSDNNPIISYYDMTNKNLKVAHCEHSSCSSIITTTVYTWEDSGKYNSIIIGADGLPVIAFNTYIASSGSGFLMVAHCATLSCDKSLTEVLDTKSTNIGMYTSIAIGMDGLPIISYHDEGAQRLKVIHCANTQCGAYRRGR